MDSVIGEAPRLQIQELASYPSAWRRPYDLFIVQRNVAAMRTDSIP